VTARHHGRTVFTTRNRSTSAESRRTNTGNGKARRRGDLDEGADRAQIATLATTRRIRSRDWRRHAAHRARQRDEVSISAAFTFTGTPSRTAFTERGAQRADASRVERIRRVFASVAICAPVSAFVQIATSSSLPCPVFVRLLSAK